jgi:hypothetical protein
MLCHQHHPLLILLLLLVPILLLLLLLLSPSLLLLLLLLPAQEGDLLVHFPGGMKAAIANMTSKWLQAVPVLPHSLSDATAGPPIFTITRAAGCTAAGSTAAVAAGSTATVPGNTAAGKLVHVTMHSDLYAKQSSMPREFELCVRPGQQGSNWGWPITPEPAEFKAVLQRQLWQRQAAQKLL